MNRRIFWLLLLFTCNIYANPAPLGLPLNKATLSDVEKQYKIIKKEKNYWEGYNYYIDITNVGLAGVKELLVICNDNNIIQAVIFTANNNKFEEFYELLTEKYQPINEEPTRLTNKEVLFAVNDCTIILDAPHINFDMSLIYITNEFLTRFKDKQKIEKLLTKAKDKELL